MMRHTVKVASLTLFHPSLSIKVIVTSTTFDSQRLLIWAAFLEAPVATNAKHDIADSRI